MSEEEDTFIEDDLSKILHLFRKRNIKQVAFSQQKYEKLYRKFCCGLCKALMDCPVYLKCSHRFCHRCIQRHSGKECPSCCGSASEYRVDSMLINLINYAFIKGECQNEGNSFIRSSMKETKRERTQSLNKEFGSHSRLPRKRNMNPKTLQNKQPQLHRLQPLWTKTKQKQSWKKAPSQIVIDQLDEEHKYMLSETEEGKNCSTQNILQLGLEKLPDSPFTPKLKQKYIRLSYNSRVQAISSIIAVKLNIKNLNAIRLYTKKQKTFELVHSRSMRVSRCIEDGKMMVFGLSQLLEGEVKGLSGMIFYQVDYGALRNK